MTDAALKTLEDLQPPEPPLSGRSDSNLGEHTYDFYRCQRCQRLITYPQLCHAMTAAGALRVCPCGGLKFSPTNPRWYEFLLPRVLSFAWARARELGVSGILKNMRADVDRARGAA